MKEPVKMNLRTALLIIIVIETILLGFCFYQLKLKGEAENNSISNQKISLEKDTKLPELKEDEELKKFLGYVGDLNTFEDNNYAKENINKQDFLTNEKMMIASMYTNLDRKNDYVTYNLNDIKKAAKEMFNEDINLEVIVKQKNSPIFYNKEIDAYIDGGGDATYSVYVTKIESQTNSEGIYNVTFLYGYPSEGDFIDNTLGDCDCYRTTVKIKVNEKYQYSKYQLVNSNLSSEKVGKIKDFK